MITLPHPLFRFNGALPKIGGLVGCITKLNVPRGERDTYVRPVVAISYRSS